MYLCGELAGAERLACILVSVGINRQYCMILVSLLRPVKRGPQQEGLILGVVDFQQQQAGLILTVKSSLTSW